MATRESLIPIRAADGTVIAHVRVDAADFDWLNQWRWSLAHGKRHGYARRTEKKRHIKMHRQIMGLEYGDGQMVDHINGDKLDNRRANLRLATPRLNALNMRAKGRSGYAGVSWHAVNQKWTVRIRIDGRETYFGSYADVHEAGRVANEQRAIAIAREVERMAA